MFGKSENGLDVFFCICDLGTFEEMISLQFLWTLRRESSRRLFNLERGKVCVLLLVQCISFFHLTCGLVITPVFSWMLNSYHLKEKWK